MIRLSVDDLAVEVHAGTALVDAAACVGVDIPILFHQPGLSVARQCESCAVEVAGVGRDRCPGVGNPLRRRGARDALAVRLGSMETATIPLRSAHGLGVEDHASLGGPQRRVDRVRHGHGAPVGTRW